MKTKLFTLLITLFAIVSTSMAAGEITGLKLTFSVNGGADEVLTLPASGFSMISTGTGVTSLKMKKVEVTASALSVSDVYFYGAFYTSGDTPSASNWVGFPLYSEGLGNWVFDLGEGEEMIESGWEGNTKVFECYVKAKNSSNDDIYYNNGGQNYKMSATIGSGGGSTDWAVKYYAQSTATVDLTWNGTTNRNYSYNGNGVREQFYGENPGEVGSLVINGFSTRFIYNKNAGVDIQSVTLQYRINVDGAEGMWNGLNGTLDQEETIWNPEEERYEYRRIYYASNLNLDVAYGLEPGHNYELQLMYQVLTTGGDYIFLKKNAQDMKLAFTVTEGASTAQPAQPEYKGMSVTLIEDGTEYADIDVAGGTLVSNGCTSLVLKNFRVVLGGDNIETVRLYWRVYPDEPGGGSYDIKWNSVDATVRNGEVWSENCNIDLLGSGVNIEIPEGLQSNKAYRFYCYIAPLVKGTWLQSQEWGDLRIDIKTGTITAVESVTESKAKATNVWYDLSGNRLNGKPSQKGIYINAGNKVVVE